MQFSEIVEKDLSIEDVKHDLKSLGFNVMTLETFVMNLSPSNRTLDESNYSNENF